jgi:HlyD family secretion protein
MSSDEQRQFLARMSDRGQDTSAFEKLMSAKGAPGAKPGTPASKAGAPPKGAAAQDMNAAFKFVPKYGSAQSSQSIDALFAPVVVPESRGRAWMYIDHQLKPVSLRLGITDGTYTELLGNELQPPAEVVTVVTGLGSNRTTAAAGSGNPLMPAQRGGGPGGPGGGGPGRGR